MKKKSFLGDNPALAYISKYPEDDATLTESTEKTDVTQYTEHTESKIRETSQTKIKKDKEIKNRRVNFIMTPSLHAKLEILAHLQRISLNELVSRVMGEYAASKGEQIDKYRTLIGE